LIPGWRENLMDTRTLTPSAPHWLDSAAHLDGPGFALFHRELTRFNRLRLEPALPAPLWREDLADECRVRHAEGVFVESVRKEIRRLVMGVPHEVDAFVAWFERLRESGPGQGDPLFPWLAAQASLDEMKWFLEQEVAGEAGFDDLLAMTQVKMPEQAKLEMARNYWDEMGRGAAKGMHGPMLARLAEYAGVHPTPDNVVPEALALGNMMIALAQHRRYAFQSVGALGVIEMTAPTRAGYVDRGLRRLGVPAKKRHYFALHAVLDVKHSECWNREVLRPLVAEDPRRARAIAEGAVIRLWHGARCFDRYRREFKLPVLDTRAA
jgi:Iron-containing redox enzyme